MYDPSRKTRFGHGLRPSLDRPFVGVAQLPPDPHVMQAARGQSRCVSASRSALDHVAAHPDMRRLPMRVVVGNWLHAGVSWPRARSARGVRVARVQVRPGGRGGGAPPRRCLLLPYALAADMRELGAEADSIK